MGAKKKSPRVKFYTRGDVLIAVSGENFWPSVQEATQNYIDFYNVGRRRITVRIVEENWSGKWAEKPIGMREETLVLAPKQYSRYHILYHSKVSFVFCEMVKA